MFTEENIECDGTSSEVISQRTCQVSLFTLIEVPWSLELDESISVKIISINAYGESPFSDVGNGATIQKVPDAPTNLQNDPTVTDDVKVRFTWDEGVSNGSS